ncbi:MAG: putative membrane protein [Candidatus Paceibacteria bacterium]|jgi:uncharacterized membrane protein
MERSNRIHSLDLLRGLVMVIRALDHVRDFFGDPRVEPTVSIQPRLRSSSRVG